MHGSVCCLDVITLNIDKIKAVGRQKLMAFLFWGKTNDLNVRREER